MTRQDSNKHKTNETISIIANRLKNPIAIIKGYLEALASGDCGEINLKQKEYLNDALFNTKEMSKMLDNILDISLIDTGVYGLDKKQVSLEDISSQVLFGFYQWAQAANCKIVFQKGKDIPLVLTDPLKIKKVIENLISNAIKYNSGQGMIEVSLISKAKRDVIFSCKDNGIGIDQKDYKKIFTKFYRSDKAIEIDPAGAGLSLYISKAIIQLSGGKIWFSKNKKKGMTFSFSLPAVRQKK